MNDVDRWINLEGPEPKGLRELMDAARRAPALPADEAERLKRSLRRAVADQRRADTRRRWARPAAVAGLACAGAAAAIVLWLWLSPTGQDSLQAAHGRHVVAPTVEPSSTGAEPPGTVPLMRRPKR